MPELCFGTSGIDRVSTSSNQINPAVASKEIELLKKEVSVYRQTSN